MDLLDIVLFITKKNERMHIYTYAVIYMATSGEERICAQRLGSGQCWKRIELNHRGKKTYCVNAAAVH